MAIRQATPGQPGYYAPVTTPRNPFSAIPQDDPTGRLANGPKMAAPVNGVYSMPGSGIGNRPVSNVGGYDTPGTNSRTQSYDELLVPTVQPTYYNDAILSSAKSASTRKLNPRLVGGINGALTKNKNPFVISQTPSADLFGLNIPT